MIDNVASWILGTVIVLLGPYVWEVSDDSRGDLNKRRDVLLRGTLMIFVSSINTLMNAKRLTAAIWLFALSINASVAWFFMFFDYTIAWILIRNKIVELKNVSWFDYLGKVGAVDNWRPWRELTQWQRFWIRLAYFIVSLGIYIAYGIYNR